MTLNITLVTANAIYQSSDYRLSNPQTGRRVEVRGHKVVSVVGLPGLICFTGIASTGRESVGDWMARQLPQPNPSVSVDEAIDRLKSADDWLRHWPRERRRISFTLATWQAGRPVIALISNFQDLTGRAHSEVRLRLEVDVARPKPPWVLVTGRSDGMKGSDRRRLVHLANAPQSRMLELMAETNRQVSGRVGDDAVSASCTVGLVEPTGRMAGRVFDTEPFENIPPELAAAMGLARNKFRPKIGPDGQPEPIKLVQWASQTSTSEAAPGSS